MSRILRPFLRLESLDTVIPTFEDLLGLKIQTIRDVLCQTKILLMFEGYRVDIRGLRQTAPGSASIIIQFKAKRKWWHGIFHDQNARLVKTLQDICKAEIANLDFVRFETSTSDPLSTDEEPLELVYLHDSQAFNDKWQEGYDISPLIISPDCHSGNCFIELIFNSAAYERSGNTTVLKQDWHMFAFSVSSGIKQSARKALGLE